jgi:hypothetical protein
MLVARECGFAGELPGIQQLDISIAVMNKLSWTAFRAS